DSVQIVRKPGSRPETLWQAHEQQAQQLAARTAIRPVTSREDVISACEDLHVLLRDFHLARGVFRPRTEIENAKAQAIAERVEQVRASGYQNAEALVELEKLQDRKASKQMILWILIGSLAGFLALGAANWSWEFTLWLIPVLIFHEAGHWMAMR